MLQSPWVKTGASPSRTWRLNLGLGWTYRIIATGQPPYRPTGNNAGADSDCDRRIENRPPRSRDGSRNGSSCSSFLLFLFVARRLLIVSSSLLTLCQCSAPGVIADRQVTLSRHDLDPTIHISDFKFGPNTSGRCHRDSAGASRQQFRGRYSYPPVLQIERAALILNQGVIEN